MIAHPEFWPRTYTDDGDRQTWRTPQRLWDGLHAEFGFRRDAAASAQTAKCRRFWTEEDDALSQDWGGGQRIWCNPPYRHIDPWVRCAVAGSEAGSLVVMLVPASTGTAWFSRAVRHAVWWTFDSRVAFEPPPGVDASSNYHDSILLAFRGTDIWGFTPGWRGIRSARTGTVLLRRGQS